jgi:hypothetical protein
MAFVSFRCASCLNARTLGGGPLTVLKIYDTTTGDRASIANGYNSLSWTARRAAADDRREGGAARARAMRAFLPGAPLTWMIGLGADAVAGELPAASCERPEELT